MTDQEIIESIRLGKRDKALRFLYKEFPKIKVLIKKSGLNEIHAQEIFNDSLILLIEKLEKPDFELSSKLTTFLYGINRLMVKNALRKQNKHSELEWSDTLIITDSDLEYDFEKEEQLKQLENILTKISEKCQKIFKLFYFEKISMSQIADRLEYSSENSAKTQKYKCLQQAFQLSKKTNKA